jgi:hypothetical protein
MGLALLGSTARADLSLSGETTGSFQSEVTTPPVTVTITNSSPTSAEFQTGVPSPSTTPPTSITFTGDNFSDITSGEPLDVGIFTIFNGTDLIGTDASDAFFNLGLSLTSPTTESVALTTIDFGIVNTANHGGDVPDVYTVSFVEPSPIVVGGELLKFNVVFAPPTISINEESSVTRGDVFVTFTPVPEPSTYALWGALLVGGIIVYRRFGTMSKGVAGAA